MGSYNLKNIMLGIGIGLVFSSMINISIGSQELTVEEIKKEAAKYNLIVLTSDDIINKQTPQNDTAVTPADTLTPTTVPKPTSQAAITVNVENGMGSEKITDLLAENGLVKDKEVFLKRLGALGKHNKFKIGSFSIPIDSSYDAIIKILTY